MIILIIKNAFKNLERRVRTESKTSYFLDFFTFDFFLRLFFTYNFFSKPVIFQDFSKDD